MATNPVTIGLDIGTTNFSVSLVRNDRVEVLSNGDSHRNTPCVVSFIDDEILVGEVALSQAPHNLKNTITDIRKFMGRRIDDPFIQKLVDNSELQIVESKNKNLLFDVDVGAGARNRFTPVEIMTKLMSRAKGMAVDFVGPDVQNAVISVPSYFDQHQRRAMDEAAVLAGLNVLETIDEPIAACYAYMDDEIFKPQSKILVFNYGGSTVDATVVNFDGKKFIISSESHDENLGGRDIDELLRRFLIQKFNQKQQESVEDNSSVFWKLDNYVKKLKHKFTKSDRETVTIESLSNGKDLKDLSMTKTRFEGICTDAFSQAFEQVEIALKEADLTEKDIDAIILCGGSCNISRIKEMFNEQFPEASLLEKINVHIEEVIVQGTAIYGQTIVPANLEVVEDDMSLQEVDEKAGPSGSSVKRKIKRNPR